MLHYPVALLIQKVCTNSQTLWFKSQSHTVASYTLLYQQEILDIDAIRPPHSPWDIAVVLV